MIKPMIASLLLTGLSAAVLPAPLMAQAQPAQCGERDRMTERLGEKFGERLVAGGLTGPTRILEIWTSQETGSWTILMTEASGRSCIVAAGDDWVDFPDAMASMMDEIES